MKSGIVQLLNVILSLTNQLNLVTQPMGYSSKLDCQKPFSLSAVSFNFWADENAMPAYGAGAPPYDLRALDSQLAKMIKKYKNYSLNFLTTLVSEET